VGAQPFIPDLDQGGNGTKPVQGTSQRFKLFDWGNDVEFTSVDLRCPDADVAIKRANFVALRSNFSWNSAAFIEEKEVTLTECNVRGDVTSGTDIKARNSRFEPGLKDTRYKKCFARESVGCDPKASACRDEDARAGLQCWCPHGENGEFRGATCKNQSVTCPPGWQFDVSAAQKGEEPCVACAGVRNLYSLGNMCEQCPKGADCTRGHYDVRPSRDSGVNHGIQQGRPFYLTCASQGTLETLTARGVNITAHIAAAMCDNAEQVNMGYTAKGCGDNATLVSTPKDVLSKAGTDERQAIFYTCPNPVACSSTLVHADGSADFAEQIWGPLCALCRRGYAWSEGYKCTLCAGDTLGALVGGGIIAGIVFIIGFYAFLLHPLFEMDGVGLGTRVMARITRLAAGGCRRTTSESAETATGVPTTAGGMKGKMQAAIQAMNAAKQKLDELNDLRRQLLAAVGDGKIGSMLRCLVGFTQVTPPISCAHVGW
jgi:hypothetical protein